MIARVYLSLMREPVPYAPPDQPVLTSQVCAPCLRSFSASSSAYLVGCQTRNGPPKHGRERRLGILHADLGARDLRGVARDVVVHRLRRRELGHRRQHAERVRGQEDDVLRVAGDRGQLRVRDRVEDVAAARVLGERRVVVVDDVRGRLVLDVLEHGAELERVPDVGLLLLRQLDHLRVAAALDVEHALVGPAVLVVADQQPLGIGGQRGLAGARQAEQDRGVAAVPGLGRRAVHRQHALLRHQVVHDREHALLHLAGVLGAEDHELAARERQIDRGGRGHARGVAVRREPAAVVDHVVGLAEALQLRARRAGSACCA